MKKIFLIVLYMFIFNSVSADNINNLTEIKYKWYKEERSDGLYYPKKDKLPDYLEDATNIKYSSYSDWDKDYCTYSKENYLIEEKTITTYEKIAKTKYIRIDVSTIFDCEDNSCINKTKIYSNKEPVTYKIITEYPYTRILELSKEYDTDTLWFYIDSHVRYCIYLTHTIDGTFNNLGYYQTNSYDGQLLIPDETWIKEKATYYTETTDKAIEPNPYIKNIRKEKVCRIREINTYRYKIAKKYYDDNYHTYVEDYMPDINNYHINYSNVNNCKNDKEHLKEYVYIEQPITENDNNATNNNSNVIYETKYLDKIINKIPSRMYLIIILLILLIIIETLLLIKKKVD